MLTHLSLKAKIFILTLSLIIIPIGGYSIYSSKVRAQSFIEQEISYQRSVTGYLHDALISQLYGDVTSFLGTLLTRRSELSLLGAAFKDLLMQHEEQALAGLKQTLRRRGMICIIYPDDQMVNPTIMQARDLRDRSLQQILHEENLPAGDFFTYLQDARKKSYLSLILQIDRVRRLVLISDFSLEQSRYDALEDNVIRNLDNVIKGMGQDLDAAVFIFDHNLHLKAMQGQGTFAPELRTEYAQKAKAQGAFSLSDQQQDAVITVSYFKPFDAYVVIERSLSRVMQPIYQEIFYLSLAGILIMAAAALILRLMLSKLTRGMQILARKADEIASSDLNNPKTIAAITAALPAKGHDEVSQMAAAMRKMGISLSVHLEDLLKANRRQSRLEGELDAAYKIQMGMLQDPKNLNTNPDLDLSALLIPAKTVGGDLYEVMDLENGKTALVIGDVSDKGVPAALFMAMTLSIIRSCLSLGLNPAQTMTKVNNHLCDHNPSMMFATLFIAVYDHHEKSLTYANAGHCPALLLRDHKVSELAGEAGLVAGAMPDLDYPQTKTGLREGDLILLYTDGITEAQNPKQELFGLDRTKEVLTKLQPPVKAADALGAVKQAAFAFRQDALQSDDFTMLGALVK